MLKHRRSILALASCLTAASLLAACGFHLRGSQGETALSFKTVYVSVGETSAFGGELKRYIRASGPTQVVTDPKAAEAIIDILSEIAEESILTLNSQGRVRELALYYKLRFRVRDAKGRELLQPTDIVLKRDMSFNEAVVLSKDAEKALLYKDMRSDMVQQVMRRLVPLKPAESTPEK